jgi:hypothetical protein
MTTTGTRHVDVAPRARWSPGHTALVLAVAALVLSFIAWEWFDWGGVVLGVPLAVAAFALGTRARRASSARTRGFGTAAMAVAVVVVLIPLVWMAAA